jgi:hypothetical protein
LADLNSLDPDILPKILKPHHPLLQDPTHHLATTKVVAMRLTSLINSQLNQIRKHRRNPVKQILFKAQKTAKFAAKHTHYSRQNGHVANQLCGRRKFTDEGFKRPYF